MVSSFGYASASGHGCRGPGTNIASGTINGGSAGHGMIASVVLVGCEKVSCIRGRKSEKDGAIRKVWAFRRSPTGIPSILACLRQQRLEGQPVSD